DEKDRLINEYFPVRTNIVLDQLRSLGFFPEVSAPVFNQYEGTVSDNFELTMSVSEGNIYFTLDGSDPRLIGGNFSNASIAYQGPISIGTHRRKVKARAFKDGEWSALTEAEFNPENILSTTTSETGTGIRVYPNPFSSNLAIGY